MSQALPRLPDGMPIRLIGSQSALEEAAREWLDHSAISLDTEFMRVRTFHAQAALFQICDGESCCLVDPLAVENLEPLKQVLAAPAPTKIMHSCSEDLELCRHRLGVLPEPLVDTQIIAAFCGHPLSVGYQRILASELDVRLDKSETRTDWLQRPLSPAQLRYAAEDVAFLLPLWQKLERRLAGRPSAGWALAECSALLERYRARTGTDYRAMAGAWRFDRRTLAVLRALHAWREETASSRDLPRNWLLADTVLLAMAQEQPRSTEALAAIDGVSDKMARRHGATLLTLISQALDLGQDELPDPVPPPLDAAQSRRLRKLRAHTVVRADEQGVAPEMLARRRDFEELLRWVDGTTEQPLPGLLAGWRRKAIGEELAMLAREAS